MKLKHLQCFCGHGAVSRSISGLEAEFQDKGRVNDLLAGALLGGVQVLFLRYPE